MSDQAPALGQWPNAPLALVLAQIRFDPEVATEYPGLAKHIKAATGDQFQAMKSVKQLSFVLGDAGQNGVPAQASTEVGLDLRRDDERSSLRIQEGAVTYTTSLYKDSRHFLAEWRSVLDILCREGGVKALRIGLRYIDFIIPSTGKLPEDYFDPGFARSPKILGDQAPVAFLRYDYTTTNNEMMRVQYGRGFAPPDLPPDLVGSVQPPPSLLEKYTGGASAVLDIDHWCVLSARLQANELAAEFKRLRDHISEAFRRIISDAAKDEWTAAST